MITSPKNTQNPNRTKVCLETPSDFEACTFLQGKVYTNHVTFSYNEKEWSLPLPYTVKGLRPNGSNLPDNFLCERTLCVMDTPEGLVLDFENPTFEG